ncbi:hypothetical protein HELRODRAFT_193868 [Helobdella robusta]|uniref:FYVE-type domain-containing protein n=1 Tax=Helobdella robusta TaxID=6412 RepID=T1FVF5_HELRO|nr:hypothetical protein HELRODRAFT_193868 [Helobdella robusta]ESN94003.1 hypothetical protein HELRODRAFT_193868 [Helobdella robusta]
MAVVKLELNGEINNYDENVVAAQAVPSEDGVICISDDKTIKVWIRRSTGQYWPSICYNLPARPSCMSFNEDDLQIFVGLESGVVMEFKVAEDYNKLSHVKNYAGHTAKVTCVTYISANQQIVTCSSDRCVVCFSCQSGTMLAAYQHISFCTSLQYDRRSSTVLVGDTAGNILVLLWKNSKSLNKIAIFKKHDGTINELLLMSDDRRSVLLSAGQDGCIGVHQLDDEAFKSSLKLTGHSESVLSMHYCADHHRLLSIGSDKLIASWDLKTHRKPPGEWRESDACEVCSTPFYWNFKLMIEKKVLGVRQHHCRHCGRAVCMSCSNQTIQIPNMGFEQLTRVCQACHETVLNEKQKSQMVFSVLPLACNYVHCDESKELIVTSSGKLGVIQIWNAKSLLMMGSSPS